MKAEHYLESGKNSYLQGKQSFTQERTVWFNSERSSMNNKFYCGVDVSKKKLDVMLLVQEKYHYKVVENSNDGVIFSSRVD